jgi:hypothetical protein
MIPFHRKNLRRMCRCLRGFKFMVWLLPRQAWRQEYLSILTSAKGHKRQKYQPVPAFWRHDQSADNQAYQPKQANNQCLVRDRFSEEGHHKAPFDEDSFAVSRFHAADPF